MMEPQPMQIFIPFSSCTSGFGQSAFGHCNVGLGRGALRLMRVPLGSFRLARRSLGGREARRDSMLYIVEELREERGKGIEEKMSQRSTPQTLNQSLSNSHLLLVVTTGIIGEATPEIAP